jgi:RNA polymerase sigma-70 factor (ECF subfamily)
VEREAAFRRLAEHHIESSYRLANAILGDAAESRDAVHDAFITAWQRWPSLRDPAKFEWWFKRIVVNTCRNRLRDRSVRRAGDITAETVTAGPDALGRSHDRIVIEQALAGLKPDDRVVLALRYYHDLKLDDIATLLDVPTGTVKSRLNHAHARLRAAIERTVPGRTST